MKQNISIKYLMMAMVAVVCMTFSACGGDDDDLPDGNSDFEVGVHRVDIQFDTNGQAIEAQTIINAVRTDGTQCALYENGKQISSGNQPYAWYTEEVRNFSIQTDDKCICIVANVAVWPENYTVAKADINVTCVGYVNNKEVYRRTVTLPKGKKTLAIGFTTDTHEDGVDTFYIE